MATEVRKAVVGVTRFAVAPIIKDDASEFNCGNVVEFDKALITAKYTPKMNTGALDASDQTVDSYVNKNGGTLEIGITALTSDDEVLLFGSKKIGKVVRSNKDDVVPELMVIYETKRSDGTVNLYKFPKARFTSQGESAQTKTKDGATYATITLNAEYMPTINNGDDMYSEKGVDLATDAILEEAWFATASGGVV